MANAALQDTGRSVICERQEAMATGEYQLPRAKITVKNCDTRTPEERQADNQAQAAELGVSRMFLV